MSGRYFVESAITAERVSLTGSEAHHLARVMRASPGTEVVLFDGSGDEFSARVTSVGRSTVDLQIVQRQPVDRELPISIHLGVPLPKGDRQRWLIEKCVELGVRRVVPLKTVRGVAQPVQQALVRLRRSVIEASKQCGRNRLMEIVEPCPLSEFLITAPATAARFVAHPHGSARLIPRDDLLAPFHAGAAAVGKQAPGAGSPVDPERVDLYLAVGPEGGFTEEEIGVVDGAAWQVIRFGARTLRIETAAIALVSLFAMLSET